MHILNSTVGDLTKLLSDLVQQKFLNNNQTFISPNPSKNLLRGNTTVAG